MSLTPILDRVFSKVEGRGPSLNLEIGVETVRSAIEKLSRALQVGELTKAGLEKALAELPDSLPGEWIPREEMQERIVYVLRMSEGYKFQLLIDS